MPPPGLYSQPGNRWRHCGQDPPAAGRCTSGCGPSLAPFFFSPPTQILIGCTSDLGISNVSGSLSTGRFEIIHRSAAVSATMATASEILSITGSTRFGNIHKLRLYCRLPLFWRQEYKLTGLFLSERPCGPQRLRRLQGPTAGSECDGCSAVLCNEPVLKSRVKFCDAHELDLIRVLTAICYNLLVGIRLKVGASS